jgi:hypothetical protein
MLCGYVLFVVPPVQELCSLAKHLQPGARQALFSKLAQLGLYDVVARVMTLPPPASHFQQHNNGGSNTSTSHSQQQQQPHSSGNNISVSAGGGGGDGGDGWSGSRSGGGWQSVKLRATDVLMSAMAHDPLPLRQFLVSNKVSAMSESDEK